MSEARSYKKDDMASFDVMRDRLDMFYRQQFDASQNTVTFVAGLGLV